MLEVLWFFEALFDPSWGDGDKFEVVVGWELIDGGEVGLVMRWIFEDDVYFFRFEWFDVILIDGDTWVLFNFIIDIRKVWLFFFLFLDEKVFIFKYLCF